MFNFIEQLRRRLAWLNSSSAKDVDDKTTTQVYAANNYEDDTDETSDHPVRIEIRDSIDLHTFAPRDIPRIVEEYLREARARGFRTVRIIHGKGTGTQRAVVRHILDRTDFVSDYADAPPYAGGWGATVVHLRANDSRSTTATSSGLGS